MKIGCPAKLMSIAFLENIKVSFNIDNGEGEK